MKKHWKVVLGIPTNSIGGREEMSGVFRWLGEHPVWEPKFFDTRTDILNGEFEAAAHGADGAIVATTGRGAALISRLLAMRLKVVTTDEAMSGAFAGRRGFRALTLDGFAVGRDAAHHFNSLGRFASYGFVHGPAPLAWSVDRERGFRAAAPARIPVFAFPEKYRRGDVSPLIPPKKLAAFLRSLPKPAAVMGANDLFASQVLSVCENEGIAVPGEVAVLGCDNEPLICENTRPRLSSLRLAFGELGYRAAAALDAMLRGAAAPAPPPVAGTRLFERGSSARVPPATALVDKALAFIAECAKDGISSRDVVAHCGVSRSLLDLRFRQLRGRSILAEITDRRMEALEKALAESRAPIVRVGRECGFRDAANLKRTFRARTGMTMGEWRKSRSGDAV